LFVIVIIRIYSDEDIKNTLSIIEFENLKKMEEKYFNKDEEISVENKTVSLCDIKKKDDSLEENSKENFESLELELRKYLEEEITNAQVRYGCDNKYIYIMNIFICVYICLFMYNGEKNKRN
jgi:hypothetical protein